ncbi:ABC transporter permease [Litorihabitans aurantiacus]|uniref:Nitrate ABC transporter permease n=1 Tax=Litorihabitans aurantiacus TaxID=1930061 RepID=A0AA37UGT1_9MICO|nr:ABC transporter permease subunit [Litorihabitans aurantiacus]GMA30144.1 nitrate ABC transporter permease [Litorihabitans aurantiacus]
MSTDVTAAPPGSTDRPGSADEPEVVTSRVSREARRAVTAALTRSVSTFALTIVAVVVLWFGVLAVFDISPLIAKNPVDVWNYFTTVPAAADNRALIGGNVMVTLGHAGIGFISGLVAATVGALSFQLSKGVEHSIMPAAMLLRSVPLIAMAPVIILIFGRGNATIAVIGGIVVLFPALVTISFGLRSAATQMNDLIAVYGGGTLTRLRLVAVPSSLPAFFAAVRISVPGAITGALLAEWLATGGGVGGSIGGFIPQAQFTALWASVAGITAVSLVLYNVVQIAENVVLARMGMTPRKGV